MDRCWKPSPHIYLTVLVDWWRQLHTIQNWLIFVESGKEVIEITNMWGLSGWPASVRFSSATPESQMSEAQCCLRLVGENFAFLSLQGVGQPITHVAVWMCVCVCLRGEDGKNAQTGHFGATSLWNEKKINTLLGRDVRRANSFLHLSPSVLAKDNTGMVESTKECRLEVTVLVSHLGTFTHSHCGWYHFITIQHPQECAFLL